MAKTGPASSGREYDIPGRWQRQVYVYGQVTRPELAGRLTGYHPFDSYAPTDIVLAAMLFVIARGFFRTWTAKSKTLAIPEGIHAVSGFTLPLQPIA